MTHILKHMFSLTVVGHAKWPTHRALMKGPRGLAKTLQNSFTAKLTDELLLHFLYPHKFNNGEINQLPEGQYLTDSLTVHFKANVGLWMLLILVNTNPWVPKN